MDQRFSAERMPILRTRVPRERVRKAWLGRQGRKQLEQELAEFQAYLGEIVEEPEEDVYDAAS